MSKGGPIPPIPDLSELEKKDVEPANKDDNEVAAAALNIGAGPAPILPASPKDGGGFLEQLKQLAGGCFSMANNSSNETTKSAFNEAGDIFSDPESSPELINETVGKLSGLLGGLSGAMDHVNGLTQPLDETVQNVTDGVEKNPITNGAIGAIAGVVGFETEDLTGMAKGASTIGDAASKLAGGALSKNGSTKEGFNALADGAKKFSPAASKLAGKVSGLAAGWAAGAVANWGCTAAGAAIGTVCPGAGNAAGAVIGAAASTVITGAASSIATSVVDSTVSAGGEMLINAGADVGAKVAGEGADALKGGIGGAVDSVAGGNESGVDNSSQITSVKDQVAKIEGSGIFGAEQPENNAPANAAEADPMSMVTDVVSSLGGKEGGSPLDMVSGLVGGLSSKMNEVAPDITEAAKLK